MNFAQFLELHARGDPDAIALVDRRLQLTWAELDALTNRFANRLTERGVAVGDRVAIWLPNRAEGVIAFLGAMKLGAIPVPMNWRLQATDVGRLLSHCAPSVVVTDAERLGQLDAGLHGRTLEVTATPRDGTFWRALDGASDRYVSRPCQAAEVANLLYTSGTTSTPKAAIHTHGMRVAVASAMADCFRLSRRDVGLAVSPLFHTSGLSVFSNCLFVGCRLVLLDRWDLAEFLDAIARERVTFLHVIGTIVVDIARAPESAFAAFRPETVRFAWGGGHSLDPEAFLAYERRIGGVLLQGYSRTEGGLTYNPLERERRRFDHNGLPNRNSSDIAIVDPAGGRPLAAGETGEIVVRGDGVSPGYWDGDFVRSPRLVDGGWQPTGDLGYFDAEGALHFLGRRDLMIKTGGENVYPAEVEAVLLAMPGVADAVVLGLPDPRLGQRVAAAIVRADTALTEADVDRACRDALGGFKIPRTVRFVDALPRLGTQKVDLAACRELLMAPG